MVEEGSGNDRADRGRSIDDDLKEYDLENYDEPTEEEKATGECMLPSLRTSL